MSTFYVYTHSDPVTNLVRYVGKGKGKRAQQLYCRGPHHQAWIDKLESSGLKPVIQIIELDLAEQQAYECERLHIIAYRQAGMPLTNLTDGGEGGFNPSLETRKKQSLAKLGKPSHMKGKTHSEQTRLKISEANKGKPSPMKGKCHTDEAKQKNTASHLGKPNVHSRISVQDDLGNMFSSVSQAADFHGILRTVVTNVLSGYSKQTKSGRTFSYLKKVGG